MKWQIKSFEDLSADDVYEICKARYEVFACEQKIFQENDFDDIDKESYHVFLKEDGIVKAYARIVPAGINYDSISIGRVLVLKECRRKGIAKELVQTCVDFIKAGLNEDRIVLSAQLYVKSLYESVGFKAISDVYDEVDIPHVKMELK